MLYFINSLLFHKIGQPWKPLELTPLLSQFHHVINLQDNFRKQLLILKELSNRLYDFYYHRPYSLLDKIVQTQMLHASFDDFLFGIGMKISRRLRYFFHNYTM